MPDEDKKIWFYVKSYGYGWGLPASWQGWVVLALYLALVFATVRMVPGNARVPVVLILTLIFVVVVACKGERPVKWRWGKD